MENIVIEWEGMDAFGDREYDEEDHDKLEFTRVRYVEFGKDLEKWKI